jgi:hypothetical protein
MHKTKDLVEVPLMEEAQKIIDKYQDHADRGSIRIYTSQSLEPKSKPSPKDTFRD